MTAFGPGGRSISDFADTAIKEAEAKNAAHANDESAVEDSRLNRGNLNNQVLNIRHSAIAHPLDAIDKEVRETMKEMEVVDPSSIKRDLLSEKGLLLDRTGSSIFDPPELGENTGNSRNRDDRATATTYAQWRGDEDSPVLLILGRPGAGKTMLSISLIDEIRSDILPNGLFVYFFIIAARDDRNTSRWSKA